MNQYELLAWHWPGGRFNVFSIIRPTHKRCCFSMGVVSTRVLSDSGNVALQFSGKQEKLPQRKKRWSHAHLQTMSRGFWCVGCHGTSFIAQHGYFNNWEGSSGLNEQSKRFPLVSGEWPPPVWSVETGMCEVNNCIREWLQHFERGRPMPHSPQKEVVASRLRSRGGAHLAHIPWHAG